MSALVFRLGRLGAYHRRCAVQTCQRSPLYLAFILDYPVGRVCSKHRGEWQRAWDAALAHEEDLACAS